MTSRLSGLQAWSFVQGVAVLAAAAVLGVSAAPAADGEQRFLALEQAPAAVFPDADAFERVDVPSTAELRATLKRRMKGVRPSLWEEVYVTFVARRGGAVLGYAVVLEEIGKHRPITSIVGVRPDGRVQDVAVMVYREAYGGEVQHRRFLDQYPGHGLDKPLVGQIRNIAGATLSVEALNRTASKGVALVDALYLHPEATPPSPRATADR